MDAKKINKRLQDLEKGIQDLRAELIPNEPDGSNEKERILPRPTKVQQDIARKQYQKTNRL